MWKRLNTIYTLSIIALMAILFSGAYYADRVYEAPQAPPNIIHTIKGPVVLFEDAVAGELITAPNLGTIYYLNADLKRDVFPDEQTFTSWYNNYDEVKTIPRDVLESYPLSGKNVTIRPGTYLVTIPSSPQVWMIGHPDSLYWLADGEEQVISLFGENWSERLVDIPEYYFVNYTQGPDIFGDETYPAGLIVYAKSNGQYYLVTPDLGQRILTEEGMEVNHFQKKFAIERDEPLPIRFSGPPITGYEARYASPDLNEQYADEGPVEIEIGDAEMEAV